MQTANRNQQVRRVLWLTLFLNMAVAISKIIVGLLSGVLAITADGLHSMSDGTGNIAGLIATRMADRPPDDDHPYGHSRFESLAALVIGGLLLLTAVEIARGALERLGGGEEPHITPLTFGVMMATLAVNLFIATYEMRQGKRLESQILQADALHTRADVFVTLSVIGSMLVIVLLGWQWVDVVAALVITLLVARTAWKVLRETAGVLVDTAPYAPDDLARLVQAVPSVDHVARVRSRGPASNAHVDVDVQVAPAMTADQTAAIAGAIEDKIQGSLKGVTEVVVRFVPQANAAPDYALTARARADALGLATHEVHVSDVTGGKLLEMHVEVPANQTLDAAHEQVSRLEAAIRRDLPDVVNIISHIEPAMSDTESAVDYAAKRHARDLEKQVLCLLGAHQPGLDWHDVRVLPFNGSFALSLHVTLPAQLSVEAAHRIAEDAETLLRSDMPQLERVVIHTEPPEA